MKNIFKYINPYYWINRKRNKIIYQIIIEAKRIYISYINDEVYTGMCVCINEALSKVNINLKGYDIVKAIPEFNKKFCNADDLYSLYWWPRFNVEPRLKAFDKLLECYKNKI